MGADFSAPRFAIPRWQVIGSTGRLRCHRLTAVIRFNDLAQMDPIRFEDEKTGALWIQPSAPVLISKTFIRCPAGSPVPLP